MRVVGIGDQVIDLYYQNNALIGGNGGKTVNNIIFNLAHFNIKTSLIGTCGNDFLGHICLTSLIKQKVDITNIFVINKPTKRFHISIDENITSKECPICHKKSWYQNVLKVEDIINKINIDDIILIDEFNYFNIRLLEKINNMIMIDIGYYNYLEKINNNDLLQLFKRRFEIVNMNQRVSNYLKKRFDLLDDKSLLSILNAELLIITKGNKGANFIFNGQDYQFNLIYKGNEIDTNGAGDMFFASIIRDYIKNNYTINTDFINKSFIHANYLVTKVVTSIGSRSHTEPLYWVDKTNKCTCYTK